MSKALRAVLSLAVMFTLAVVTMTGQGQEKTGQTKQALVNGTVVSAQIQEEYGLLTVVSSAPGGGSLTCSASLLTNDWAITAAHCFNAANISKPASVTVTANWKTVQQRQAAQIVTFGNPPNWTPWDVALIRLNTRMVVLDSTDNFKQVVWGDGPYTNLNQYPIEMFGRGINQFASGSGATAIPSQQDGQYRFGKAVIRSVDGSRYWYASEIGPTIAGGDSGGPSFVTLRVGRALIGVHSSCQVQCVPGQLCGTQTNPPPGYAPWQWVSATPKCGDAPVEPIWGQISQVITTTRSPAPAAPPSQFLGTFGVTPANYHPVFLYAITTNGDMLWYRQDSNTSKWLGPKHVGNGWASFTDVIPAGGNCFFALTADGHLKWYRHDGFNDGSSSWTGPIDVGGGWTFRKIFSGSDGVVYAIKDDGSLVWSRLGGYAGGAANTWSGPTVVGSGWSQFKDVFSMGQGVIYGVRPSGQIVWYRHEGYLSGEPKWSGDGVTVGNGWQNFTSVVPVGDGILLALTDGKMLWFKHEDYLTGTSDTGIMKGTGHSPADKFRTGPRVLGAPHWKGPVQVGDRWFQIQKIIALLPATPMGPR